jgi:ABC-type glycerol-3-phosphate transport system permease component
VVVPLWWGLATSLKTTAQFSRDVLGFFPKGGIAKWGWSNYTVFYSNFQVTVPRGAGFKRVNLPEMVMYSLIYSLGTILVSMSTQFIMAYAVARFNFKMNKVIYTIVIVTMVLPLVGTLPAQLELNRVLGLYNNIPGIFIRAIGFGGAAFLILYASLKSIPMAFSEAAYIDGASEFMVMLRVILPLNLNIIFILSLQDFIGLWNDYQTPLLYIRSYPTFAYGLFKFNNSAVTEVASVPVKLSVCMILIAPILVIFGVFHKKLMGGLNMGGLKG